MIKYTIFLSIHHPHPSIHHPSIIHLSIYPCIYNSWYSNLLDKVTALSLWPDMQPTTSPPNRKTKHLKLLTFISHIRKRLHNINTADTQQLGYMYDSPFAPRGYSTRSIIKSEAFAVWLQTEPHKQTKLSEGMRDRIDSRIPTACDNTLKRGEQ